MPKFADISKSVDDFLGDKSDFGEHGVDNVNYKFKTAGGFDVEFDGSSKGGNTTFEHTAKYSTKAGIDLKEQFESAKGVITLEATTKKLAKGSKVVVKTKWASEQFQNKSVEIKADYTTGPVALDAAYKSDKNTLDVNVGFTKGAFVVGGATKFDTSAGAPQFKSFDAAFGYAADDYQLSSAIKGSKVIVSGHYVASDAIDVYSQTSFQGSDVSTKVGASYKYDGDTKVQGLFDNSKQLDLVFSHQLRKEVELVLSTQVNVGARTAETVGMALNFTA
jgi:hypothetical protein